MSAGTVHGGLVATMFDSCMGLAVQSTLPKGVGFTTREFKLSFVRPITPETGPIKAVDCHQPWSPDRNCGRTRHGRHWALARSCHNHLLDLHDVTQAWEQPPGRRRWW